MTARPIPKSHDSNNSQSQSQSRAASHNLALDPEHPLHITLATFRMVILADELLEKFFESFFPQSFRLSDGPGTNIAPSPASTLSGNLTTFTNLGTPVKSLISGTASDKEGFINVGRAGGVVEPGSRGLRGVLDNIVNDGMRMAAEMRKRMDETQREFERNNPTGPRRDEDDEDDDFDEKPSARRDRDHDLLEGAEVASIKTTRSDTATTIQSETSGETKVGGDAEIQQQAQTGAGTETDTETSLLDTKSVEFDS